MAREKDVALNKVILDKIIKIILSHKSVEKIAIFGSRATNSFKETSDIDVTIFAKGWSDKDVNIVKDALEENIKTPLKFDIINFYSVTKDRIKKNILQNGRVIYESRKN